MHLTTHRQVFIGEMTISRCVEDPEEVTLKYQMVALVGV